MNALDQQPTPTGVLVQPVVGGWRPYYQDESVLLYNANCMEIMPGIKADLCLTDPPYGVGKAAWDNFMPTDWMWEAARCVTCIGLMPSLKYVLRLPERVGTLEYKWTMAAHLVNGMTTSPVGFGNWIPCLIYAADGVKLHQNKSDIQDVVVGTEAKPDHPSPKPLAAVRYFLSRLPGQIVLDPFAGSGTTLLAAKEQGRKAIGIEREEKYCEEIARRLQQTMLRL